MATSAFITKNKLEGKKNQVDIDNVFGLQLQRKVICWNKKGKYVCCSSLYFLNSLTNIWAFAIFQVSLYSLKKHCVTNFSDKHPDKGTMFSTNVKKKIVTAVEVRRKFCFLHRDWKEGH